MHRLAVVLLLVACSKSAGTKEKPDDLPGTDRVAVPGGKGASATEGAVVGGAKDERARLLPEEGKLAIESPAGAKAGSEVVAKIVVTPGSEYKVNTEFPTKLTLENADGVT